MSPVAEHNAYRVLARKYRPTSFADLRGQEVLVRTLSNAIESGRIAHAFVLTGIRGIGKTTTARIIARALNCTGPKDDAGPTINPCGVCANCIAIAEDRHMDVIEMDAATNTGVDNVRDIVEAVQYAPAMGRYKIFIIDEVHMLSKSAFNALLKTLEEPPPYIKFIFATTELRKIPVTILSRCQRFDLRRLDTEALAAHLTDICGQEGIAAEAEALTLIANAGDGSVRDSLSLLDQAIAHSDSGKGVETETVRTMLGLVDRGQLFALIEALAYGDAAEALKLYRALYGAGVDVPTLLEDLAELVHFITQVKLDPGLAEDITYAQQDRESAKKLAGQLNVPALSRLWQMLLKGLTEVQYAPNPSSAVQMVLIRTAYAGTLPTPGDIIQQIQSGKLAAGAPVQSNSPAPRAVAQPSGGFPSPSYAPGGGTQAAARQMEPMAQMQSQPVAQSVPYTAEEAMARFAELAESFSSAEPILYHYLLREAWLVGLEEGRLELKLSPKVPKEAAGNIGKHLTQSTGQRWVVILSHESAHPSLFEQKSRAQAEAVQNAKENPLVQAALVAFPGAEVVDVVKE